MVPPMMRSLMVGATVLGMTFAGADEKPRDPRLFELRTYRAAPGKLESLLSRFRDHTCGLFEKHGMTHVGYWVPVDNPERQLVYLLAYPDRAARDAAWKAFLADPAWTRVVADSEAAGKLVERIDEQFLTATDFSPGFPTSAPEAAGRLFEWRVYTATPGKLPALHDRFRAHTLALFRRHGMTNGAYFQVAAGQAGAEDRLVYFLVHKDAAAAEKSWAAFRADPEWVAAKKASEEAAGGSLTVPDGVTSTFLRPVDFSALK
jgi:hypothetical protein